MSLSDRYERFSFQEYWDGQIDLTEGSNHINFRSREELERVLDWMIRIIPEPQDMLDRYNQELDERDRRNR